MTEKQSKMLIVALVVIGVVLFTLLVQVGAMRRSCLEPIIIWARDDGWPSGLWSCYGLASILFGIIVPLCLFAWAVFLAIGPKGWGANK